MSFMEKNINTFLLALVLVMTVALAGAAIYFQEKFGSLTDEYDLTTENLSQCRTEIKDFEFNLNKTLRSLTTTTQDIERYDELYSSKEEELVSTSTKLENTSKNLKQTQIELQEEKALKQKYKEDYEDQLGVNRDLEEENAILEAQKRELENSLRNCDDDLESTDDCLINLISANPAIKDDIESCRP